MQQQQQATNNKRLGVGSSARGVQAPWFFASHEWSAPTFFVKLFEEGQKWRPPAIRRPTKFWSKNYPPFAAWSLLVLHLVLQKSIGAPKGVWTVHRLSLVVSSAAPAEIKLQKTLIFFDKIDDDSRSCAINRLPTWSIPAIYTSVDSMDLVWCSGRSVVALTDRNVLVGNMRTVSRWAESAPISRGRIQLLEWTIDIQQST